MAHQPQLHGLSGTLPGQWNRSPLRNSVLPGRHNDPLSPIDSPCREDGHERQRACFQKQGFLAVELLNGSAL